LSEKNKSATEKKKERQKLFINEIEHFLNLNASGLTGEGGGWRGRAGGPSSIYKSLSFILSLHLFPSSLLKFLDHILGQILRSIFFTKYTESAQTVLIFFGLNDFFNNFRI
jgi:hypothetical protein